MRNFKLIYLKSSKEEWLEKAQAVYVNKLSHFVNFEIQEIKTKSLSRSNKLEKIKHEKDLILNKLSKGDYLVALDEAGKTFDSSRAFSKKLDKLLYDNQKIVFLIGGSYGLHSEIKERANLLISLSKLTMSHHVAQVSFLEQLYRAFSIMKGLPYHND